MFELQYNAYFMLHEYSNVQLGENTVDNNSKRDGK